MSLSQRLWRSHETIAQACLEQPFVRGIADGSLSQERFAYYVGQDAFFLQAFARAYSIAAAKAPDWEGVQAFHALAAGVLEELRLHQGYAAAWHIDLQAIEADAATRRYTDFLLATAWGHDAGTTAVAMSPCMRLYAFLGQTLATNGIPEHRYAGWIRTYSSPDFEALARQLEALADRYAAPSALTESVYRYAMLCERDFFEAAWNSMTVR